MSRKRGGKSDFDLDDVLGDLLGDDDDPPKKTSGPSTGRGAARGAKGKGKPGVFDDAFYSQLAAEAASESSMSEADPAELAKSLADLDDMDSALFGGKSPTPKTPPSGAKAAESLGNKGKTSPQGIKNREPTALSSHANSTPAVDKSDSFQPKSQALEKKTMSASSPSTSAMPSTTNLPSTRSRRGSASRSVARSKKTSIDFDEDDPLAGLLSDDEDMKPKKPSLKKALGDFDDSPTTPASRPSTTQSKDEDNLSTSSRRLEIERPPTRSGNDDSKETERATTPKRPAGRRKADEITFDDDDVLGGMGFDDEPPRSAPASRRSADTEERKGRSIMDDLLGKDSVAKHLERPGTGDSKRETFLDTFSGSSSLRKEKEEKEEDFQFGGYMPSAAGGTGSRPSSRRSVRFEEDEDIFGERPTSRGSTGGRRKGAASFLEDMVDKDDRDWLDIASGSSAPAKKEADDKDRPRSTGSLADKPPPKPPGTANSAASEPVDWLGLSRLGSPEARQMPKAKEPAKTATDPSDFLGLKDESSSKAGQSSKDDDDWLGLSGPKRTNQSQRRNTPDKTDDWLGTSRSKEAKADDWLGIQDSSNKQDDDWLGLKESPGGKQDSTADYLGLDNDVDPDTLTSKPSLSRTADFADEIFKTSTKKDTSSTLPWDTPSGARRGRRQQTPPSPRHRTGPFADSSQDLFNEPSAGPKLDINQPKQQEQPSRQPQQRQQREPHQQQQQILQQYQQEEPQPMPQPTPQPILQVVDRAPASPVVGRPVQVASPAVQSAAALPAHLTQPLATPTTMHLPTSVASIPSPLTVPTFTPVQPAVTFSPGMDMNSSLLQQQQLMEQQMAAARQQMLQQQEEALKQQQQVMMQKQQQEQMQLQQQMAAQQEQLRQQQQQQLAALQEAQQHLMMQHMAPPALPQMSSLGFGSLGMSGTMGGYGFDSFETQVKKLEMEKRHLEAMMEMTRKQHAEELKLLEESHQKRTQLLEETFEKREKRLMEEADLQTTRHNTRIEQVEAEKAALVTAHMNSQQDWTRQKQATMEQVAEQHRVTLESLKKEHSEAIERMRTAKTQEVEALASQHDHARSLKSVMQQVSDSTRDLGDLRDKVLHEHTSTLDHRENAAKARDQQLQSLQERLDRQQHETEVERARLTGLITKLELQLTEQARTTEEEKWHLKQEETRIQTQQTSLEQERAHLLEKINREKLEVQKAKDRVIEEQKTTMAQLYEERRALAGERAQFNLQQKLRLDQEQRESLKNIRSEADLDSSIRVLNDEKERLRQQASDLHHNRDKFNTEHAVVEEQKRHLALEKEKLEHIALQVKQRSQDIEDMCSAAAKARDDGQMALAEARRLEAEQNQRLNNIQAQLAALRAREKNIAQERLGLAREKASLEKSQHSMLCVSCRTPIKDTNNHMVSGSPKRLNLSPAALGLLNALNPSPHPNADVNLDSVSSAIEMDRTVRMWRINANKDKDFLEEESMFLEAIKHSPYHSSAE